MPEEAIDEHDTSKQMLTDQGVQFYTWQVDVKTQFTKYLELRDIQHIVANKRRPTTIGKVECFHRSYEEEAWRYPNHGMYIQHYNYERPHQTLNYSTPADIYFREV